MKIPSKGTGTAPHVLVSRTDAIGDVVLTLPLCGLIRALYPEAIITFLGRSYTEPVIACCTAIDHFLNADHLQELSADEQVTAVRGIDATVVLHVFPNPWFARLAARAGIKQRIGTRNRWYHWFTCTSLIALSRKNSFLHEAELNLRLLSGLGIRNFPALTELPGYYAFKPVAEVPPALSGLLDPARFNLVLHPKSHGHGAEWGLERYSELIAALSPDTFAIFISGSMKEQNVLREWIATLPAGSVNDITGTMSLAELIAFFYRADGLLASGTGPLHLAAACGIPTIGLFPSVKPLHAGRWGPVGRRVLAFESGSSTLKTLPPQIVIHQLQAWASQ